MATLQNFDLEIESSKAIQSDDDLEIVIMYLENKYGFNIDAYKLLNKYTLSITLERYEDKQTFLDLNDKGELRHLCVKNINLSLNLSLSDLIAKEEVNNEHDLRMLRLYDLSDKCKKSTDFLELIVDLLTSDIDDCVHESIEISRIFANCALVKYKKEFELERVMERYKKSNQLRSNCKVMPCFKALKYAVLRTSTLGDGVFKVIDDIKSNYSFIQVVKPISETLLLLQFAAMSDLNSFLNENQNRYDLEPLNNLAACRNELVATTIVRGLISGGPAHDDCLKILARPFTEHQILVDNHVNLMLFGLQAVLFDDLKAKLGAIQDVEIKTCDYINGVLIVTLVSMQQEKNEVCQFIHKYLDDEIRSAVIQFNFSDHITKDENGCLFVNAYLNNLKAGHDSVYFRTKNLTTGSLEVYGLTGDVNSFVAALNKASKDVLSNVEVYKQKFLAINRQWRDIQDVFDKLSEENFVKTRSSSIEFHGKFIDRLFLISFASYLFNRLITETINLSAEQMNEVRSKKSSVLEELKSKKLIVVIDFSHANILSFYSLDKNQILITIDYIRHTFGV